MTTRRALTHRYEWTSLHLGNRPHHHAVVEANAASVLPAKCAPDCVVGCITQFGRISDVC